MKGDAPNLGRQASGREAGDVSDLGHADLFEILKYVVETSGSASAGAAFVRDLRVKCHKLAALDGTLGRARTELRPGYRSFPHKGYLIFFRYAGKRFEVINIIEGHRDIDALFARDHRPIE